MANNKVTFTLEEKKLLVRIRQGERNFTAAEKEIVKSILKKRNAITEKKRAEERAEAERARREAPPGGQYEVDPVTGVRHKVLPSASKEAIRAGKKNGLDLNQMKKMIGEDEDFDIDDMNKTADLFLGHLRVPPSKEEMAAIKKARQLAERRRRAEYEARMNEMNERFGSNDDGDNRR